MEDRKEEEMMDEKELASEDVIPEERDGAQAGEEGCEASEAGGAEAAEEEELNKESEEPGDGEEPEDGEAASEADGKEQTAKKSFFKKKKDKKDEQIEELTDRVKRTMAEFDNYRKRTEKEKAAMYEIGVKSVFEKLLSVVDNFERGLATLEEEQKQEPFAAGMDKTYQLLLKLMEEMEVKPIEAVGAEFDPNLHNAVMHVDDEEAGDNVIVEEFQKGYTYRDSVIRPSMVKVAN